MDYLQITILSVVQGLTEFLPISSSGHLVIAEEFLGLGEDSRGARLQVNIVLHVGTLLSVLVFYWHRVWRLLGEDWRIIPKLIVGTIPAAVIGLPLKEYAEGVLESPMLAGAMLPLTGVLLLLAVRLPSGQKTPADLSYSAVVLIGIFQAFALLPGISRSGSTIFAGLLVGLSRREAATFAFLLAIPAIGGAGLIEGLKLAKDASGGPPLAALLLGAALSFAVGLFALWWLITLLERGRWHYFAFWVIPLGLGVLVWQLAVVS